jgi:KaiC/GvpD/RAD55 family RecA-like ATPase
VVSTGIPTLNQILGAGYPDGSSILVVGQPGIGKEALGYWFVYTGLSEGDYCLYVTHRRVSDVLTDMRGFGLDVQRPPDWIANSGSEMRCDLKDQASISFTIKKAVERNRGRRIRIVTDILSPLLVLNPSESMYSYWSQLIAELKQYGAVMLAIAERGMHLPTAMTSMEQLFDGVIEMRVYEQGSSLRPC